jgi:hypothetical protein
VDICNRRRASTAIIRVVGYGEEPYSLLKTARLSNLLVEVPNDGDIKCGGAGFDPVQANLVAMPRMDRLDLIAEIIYETHHGLEIPAFAAHALPYLAVILKGAKRDQGVMR